MREPIVQITGLPDEGAHAIPEYWRRIATRDKCPRCGVPAPLTRRIDGPIPLFEGTRSVLAPVWGIQPYLVGAALYEAIRSELPPHWVWRVIPDDRSRGVAPVGVRVRPRHCPMVHAPGHTPTRCGRCGQLKYAKGTPGYVVRDELPAFAITQVRGCWFIAESGFARRLAKRFPRRLRLDPIEVRDESPAAIEDRVGKSRQ